MRQASEMPTLILGSQGISKEVYYLLRKSNMADNLRTCQNPLKCLGFVEQNKQQIGKHVTDGLLVVAADDTVEGYIKNYEHIAIIIPFGDPSLKKRLHEIYARYENVTFPNLIHPTAILPEGLCKMGVGNIISAQVVMTCDINIGNFNLFNICCTVAHDANIGSYNTVNPMAVISGNVCIKNECLLGANATVLQGLEVSSKTTIGAGAVVTKSTVGNETLIGVPAKPLSRA